MKPFFSYIVCAFLVVLLAGCGDSSGLPDMRETNGYRETKPFGTSVAYELLQQTYPKQFLQVKKKSFSDIFAWTNDTAALYVNVSKCYYADEDDANALLNFVFKGNTAFIAASQFDTILLNKLYCKETDFAMQEQFLPENYLQTRTSLVPAVLNTSDSIYQYYYQPFANYFSTINDGYARIVGYNNLKQPNFIVFFWGKGRLFLHCDARAFSNYFLLQKNNYQYLSQPLQVLPAEPEHIYWDDFYNKKNYPSQGNKRSLLSALWSHPPLRWAFLLLMALFILYLVFNSKRRQRIIPVIRPVQNSSVKFAEAIAGLYLKEKNNKSISDKMITYFNEYIRGNYFLNVNTGDKEFLSSLSKKSGVPLEKTETLFRTMQQLSNISIVTDAHLVDLNNQIQQFYKLKA